MIGNPSLAAARKRLYLSRDNSAASASRTPYTLTAVATDSGGRTGTTTRVVNLQKALPPVITAYLAEVTSITPAISYGQTPITISGRAKDRLTNAAVGNATLKVILTVNGFKRQLNIVTDAAGNFAYPFVPQAADAGTYSVIMGKQVGQAGVRSFIITFDVYVILNVLRNMIIKDLTQYVLYVL